MYFACFAIVTGLQVRGTVLSVQLVKCAIWQGQCHTLEQITFVFLYDYMNTTKTQKHPNLTEPNQVG